MGWWKTETGELVGDGPLDELDAAIERVVADYVKDQGRKPTLEEILECLRLTLKVALEDAVSSPTGVELLSIKAKTARSSRPRPVPGAVFSVPLSQGYFAFGRLTPQSGIADFYRLKSKKRALAVNKLQPYEVFRLDAMIPDDGFKSGQWRIHGHLDYPVDGFVLTQYRMGNQVTYGCSLRKDGFIYVSGESRIGTEEELAALRALSISNVLMAEHRLNEALADAPIA